MNLVENSPETPINSGLFPGCIPGDFVFGNDLKVDVRTGNLISHGEFETAGDLNMTDAQYEEWIAYKKSQEAEGIEVSYSTEKIDTSDYYATSDKMANDILDNFIGDLRSTTDEKMNMLTEMNLDKAMEVGKKVIAYRALDRKNKMEKALLAEMKNGSDEAKYDVIKDKDSNIHLIRNGKLVNLKDINNKELRFELNNKRVSLMGKYEGATPSMLGPLDELPVFSDAKDVILAVNGKDEYGEEIPTWQKVLAAAPFISLGMVRKGEEALDHVDDATDALSALKNKLFKDGKTIDIDFSKISKKDLHKSELLIADYLDSVDKLDEKKFNSVMNKLLDMRKTSAGREQLKIMH